MAITLPRTVLGCLLAHPEWYPSANRELGALAAACFAQDKLDNALWETLGELTSKGEPFTPIDALLAANAADSPDALKQIRGLLDLTVTETAETFTRHLKSLHAETLHRVALGGMQRFAQKGAETGVGFDWLPALETAREQLSRKARRRTHYRALTPDRVLDTISESRRKKLLLTGFTDIDDACGGVVLGGMTLLGARTNVGKSSVLYAFARNQLFRRAAWNVERLQESGRKADAYDVRREPAWPGKSKEQPAPHVLILSVEDDVDDYLSRFVCDMLDVNGLEYLKDPCDTIYREQKGELFTKLAQEVGGGRLTIADYEDHDGEQEKTIAAISDTIRGWVDQVQADAKDRDEEPPPMLVLLDYYQKIDDPESEEKRMEERRILAKISNRLKKLAKKKKFALVMAAMLLRGADHVEPDANDMRGGSDASQDANAIWTLWPFGTSERRALQDACAGPDDSASDSGEIGDDIDDLFDSDDAGGSSDVLLTPEVSRRARGEFLISCDKNRDGPGGWRVPLYFRRDFKRITNAYSQTIYRFDADIGKLLKRARKQASKS